MTTPEPPGEPTPPSFEKPAAGGSPYDQPPYNAAPASPPPPQSPYGDNPYGNAQPYYTPVGGDPTGAVQSAMPPLGGIWIRLLARIIDGILIAIVAVPLSFVAAAARNNERTAATVAVETGILLLYFIYEGLMLTLAGGQTVGKKAMGIRVAMLADGSPPAGSAGWIRAALYSLPNIVCCVWQLVNVLWCVWDRPYQQCLHDKAARTVVVKAVRPV
jgi:uncharacterized RDD family membrane protein YckC